MLRTRDRDDIRHARSGRTGTGRARLRTRLEPLVHPLWIVVGAALLAFRSVLLHPNTRMIGHTLGETMSHAWITWLLRRGYVRNPWSPFYHPDVVLGHDIWQYPTDFATRLAAIPLSAVLGEPITTNLVALVLLLWGGVGVFLLARTVGASRWPATLAAVLVMLHPSFLGYLADGRHDSLALGWSAVVLLMWYRLMVAPSLRHATFLAFTTAILVASSPNYALVTAIVLTVPTFYYLLRRRLKLAGPLVFAAGLATLLSLPIAATLLDVEEHSGGRLEADFTPTDTAMVQRVTKHLFEQTDMRTQALWEEVRKLDSGPLVLPMFHIPEHFLPLLDSDVAQGRFLIQPFTPGARQHNGILEPVLAVLVLVLAFRRSFFWLAGAAFLLLLSFGHGLTHGLPFHLAGTDDYFILRSAPLLARIPPLRHFANYGVFAVVGHLLAAVGIALGVQKLRPHVPGVLLASLCLVFMALWGLELQYKGPVPLPIRSVDTTLPPSVEWLAAQPGAGGVALVRRTAELERYLQIFHQRPIVSQLYQPNFAERTLKELIGFQQALASPGCYGKGIAWNKTLAGIGLEWLVLPSGMVSEQAAEHDRRCLNRLIGPAVYTDHDLYVYRLEPLAPSGPPKSGTGDSQATKALAANLRPSTSHKKVASQHAPRLAAHEAPARGGLSQRPDERMRPFRLLPDGLLGQRRVASSPAPDTTEATRTPKTARPDFDLSVTEKPSFRGGISSRPETRVASFRHGKPITEPGARAKGLSEAETTARHDRPRPISIGSKKKSSSNRLPGGRSDVRTRP